MEDALASLLMRRDGIATDGGVRRLHVGQGTDALAFDMGRIAVNRPHVPQWYEYSGMII